MFNMKNFKKNYLKISILFLILFIFFRLILIYKNSIKETFLEITFFDVGQGDSILIKTDNKETFLIDSGRDNSVIYKLEKFLPLFAKNIDYIIATHPDTDHIFGFLSVLSKYKIKNILINDYQKNNDILTELEQKIKKEIDIEKADKIEANCGDKIKFKNNNDSIIYVLSPINDNLSINESNDNSIVLLFIYNNFSFLFTGDISKEIEDKLFLNIENCFNKEDSLLIKEKIKNLTVLKVSHHGSKTSSSEGFLKKIKPEYSIISAGKNNSYGHPTKETLDILNKYSKNILSTIENGDITFSIKENNLKINLNKK